MFHSETLNVPTVEWWEIKVHLRLQIIHPLKESLTLRWHRNRLSDEWTLRFSLSDRSLAQCRLWASASVQIKTRSPPSEQKLAHEAVYEESEDRNTSRLACSLNSERRISCKHFGFLRLKVWRYSYIISILYIFSIWTHNHIDSYLLYVQQNSQNCVFPTLNMWTCLNQRTLKTLNIFFHQKRTCRL